MMMVGNVLEQNGGQLGFTRRCKDSLEDFSNDQC